MPILPANSTLAAIMKKVRLLTQSPVEDMLSTDDLSTYINDFVLYDMPERIRLQTLLTRFIFYTNPNQDVYETVTDVTDQNNPFFNFLNKYVTIRPPAYIAGIQTLYSQSEQEFFGMFPQVNSVASINQQGDGVTTTFTGNLIAYPVEQNQVLFSSIDINNNGLKLVDIPIGPGPYAAFGNLVVPNDPAPVASTTVVGTTDGAGNASGFIFAPVRVGQYFIIGGQVFTVALSIGALATVGAGTGSFDTTTGAFTFAGAAITSAITLYGVILDPLNNINYVTGRFTISFINPPKANAKINSQTVPYTASIPYAMLWFNNQFTLRPIPDQAYKVQIEAFIRPTNLLASGQSPELEEWWSYIAYGASRKVLQDRLDMETLAMIDPEFRVQEMLCQRRTLVQLSNQRIPTIYSRHGGGQVGWSNGNMFGWGVGGPF